MKIRSATGTRTVYTPDGKPVSRKVELKWRINDGKLVKSAPKTNPKRRKAS